MAKFPIETVAKLILPLLAVAGYICTHGVAARTGYWTLVTSQVRESRLLPGTKAPLKLRYIGITRVDNFLAALATVFWPLVDGSYAHASLQAFQFVGQLVALWTVLEIEARRFGNSWRLISL
ncbi:MAG: hypothetical protein M1816_001221 [Peltula sp. TS41687]|nr:MAG: hypothetical protein M1816_001221 [Peltula sp. TS41687]